MRIALATVSQETNSFSPRPTTLEDFRQYGLYEGGEILEGAHPFKEVEALLAVSEEEGVRLAALPIIRACAGAGGPLTAETLSFFEERILSGLKGILPIDGMFFHLHGASASEEEEDVEGHLLGAVRNVLGPNVPVVVPLDHHACLTRRMIRCADAVVGHRTQPHDLFDTATLAARALFALVRGDVHPATAWRKIPMITHQEQFLTSGGPMKEWFDLAREMEQRPGVVSISNFPMQPWLDASEGGWATVVITDGDPPLAQRLAAELADRAWALREAFWAFSSVSPEEAIRRAMEAGPGLVVLADLGDAVWGGGAGDGTRLLREMLDQELRATALVQIVDPEATHAAIEAGVGSEITLAVGGKIDTVFGRPVEVNGKVAGTGGGRLRAETVAGLESFDIGRAALLEAGGIKVALSELRGVGGNHPAVYEQFGLDPAEARMAVLKTGSNFQFYSRWTSQVIRVDTPGPTMSHLDSFEWERLPRPIYPLDELEQWQAQAQ